MSIVKTTKPTLGLMNTFFDDFITRDFFAGNPTQTSSRLSPKTNISETDEAYKVALAIPGFSKEDVSIDVKENMLHIKAEIEKATSSDKNAPAEKWRQREFSNYSFSRSFKLPHNLNREEIEASFTNGVLEVSLPKAEKETPKRIEIKVS